MAPTPSSRPASDPDVILGDMDSATDGALALRRRADRPRLSRTAGLRAVQRLQEGGLDPTAIPAAGTSQDVAMLLAHEKGAKLIVMVGAHFNLIEFLDKNRAGIEPYAEARERFRGLYPALRPLQV